MQAFFLKGRSFSKVMKKPPHMWKQYLHPASGRRACAPLFALVGGVPTASIAMVTALVNAPGTVPVLPVCQCGTTLAECFRCQFALVGGVPTASVVKITALANAPGRLYEFLYSLSTRWFDRRAERRSEVSQSVESVMTEKLGQAFQGLQVQDRVLVAPSQWSEIPSPKNQLSKG